jgi:hypothetical protein
VPTQPFDNSNLAAISTPRLSSSLQMSSYAAPLRLDVFERRSMCPQGEWSAEAVVDLRKLGRGVGWALAIEGTAAFFVCVAWHLLSLLR